MMKERKPKPQEKHCESVRGYAMEGKREAPRGQRRTARVRARARDHASASASDRSRIHHPQNRKMRTLGFYQSENNSPFRKGGGGRRPEGGRRRGGGGAFALSDDTRA
jgi:hypothetical protein